MKISTARRVACSLPYIRSEVFTSAFSHAAAIAYGMFAHDVIPYESEIVDAVGVLIRCVVVVFFVLAVVAGVKLFRRNRKR